MQACVEGKVSEHCGSLFGEPLLAGITLFWRRPGRPSIFGNTYMSDKLTYYNSPKPLGIALRATILHAFGVKVIEVFPARSRFRIFGWTRLRGKLVRI